MIKVHKLLAAICGVGYIKTGGGTIAAAIFCLVFVSLPASYSTGHWQILATMAVCVIGVWSAGKVDAIWGKDSNKVVIDEVAGMMITLLFIPPKFKFIVAGFILFRFFDIVKPLLIKKMESLPKGWGVMADDVLAGFYAHIILQLIVRYKLF